jgi:hypothetical protein
VLRSTVPRALGIVLPDGQATSFAAMMLPQSVSPADVEALADLGSLSEQVHCCDHPEVLLMLVKLATSLRDEHLRRQREARVYVDWLPVELRSGEAAFDVAPLVAPVALLGAGVDSTPAAVQDVLPDITMETFDEFHDACEDAPAEPAELSGSSIDDMSEQDNPVVLAASVALSPAKIRSLFLNLGSTGEVSRSALVSALADWLRALHAATPPGAPFPSLSPAVKGILTSQTSVEMRLELLNMLVAEVEDKCAAQSNSVLSEHLLRRVLVEIFMLSEGWLVDCREPAHWVNAVSPDQPMAVVFPPTNVALKTTDEHALQFGEEGTPTSMLLPSVLSPGSKVERELVAVFCLYVNADAPDSEFLVSYVRPPSHISFFQWNVSTVVEQGDAAELFAKISFPMENQRLVPIAFVYGPSQVGRIVNDNVGPMVPDEPELDGPLIIPAQPVKKPSAAESRPSQSETPPSEPSVPVAESDDVEPLQLPPRQLVTADLTDSDPAKEVVLVSPLRPVPRPRPRLSQSLSASVTADPVNSVVMVAAEAPATESPGNCVDPLAQSVVETGSEAVSAVFSPMVGSTVMLAPATPGNVLSWLEVRFFKT